MQADAEHANESLTEILYALILALRPYIEHLIALADPDDRRTTRTLRNLIRSIDALRAIMEACGHTPPAPIVPDSAIRRRPPALRARGYDCVIETYRRITRVLCTPKPAFALRL